MDSNYFKPKHFVKDFQNNSQLIHIFSISTYQDVGEKKIPRKYNKNKNKIKNDGKNEDIEEKMKIKL